MSEVIDIDTHEEEKQRILKAMEFKREKELRDLTSFILDARSKRFYVKKLKDAFPLGESFLGTNDTTTYYNLGKFETYLEFMVELQQAFKLADNEGNTKAKSAILKVVKEWFIPEREEN